MPMPLTVTRSTGGGDNPLVTLDVAILSTGVTLRTPIYDHRDVLLLAAGTTLTRSLLGRLTARGTSEVRVRHSEVAAITANESVAHSNEGCSPASSAPTTCDVRSDARLRRTPKAFLTNVQPLGAVGYSSQNIDTFQAAYHQAVSEVERLFTDLTQGGTKAAVDFADLSSDALSKITCDLDLFAGMGATPALDGYPCKHSLQTAMLSLSVGSVLGLKQDELLELGIGCLIHDAGMLFVNPQIVQATRVLSRIEFLEISKHAMVMFDLMSRIPNVSHGSLMVAYQMHERCDGSGYPRGRKGGQIHHLAKIASVCDVFVALISPRPYRPGMLPYHAMEQIVHGARQGLFDHSVVRSLLSTVSLFPIGSFIETADGRVGKVLRANRDQYTRPVVELWQPSATQFDSEIIDLSRTSDLQITQPITQPVPPQIAQPIVPQTAPATAQPNPNVEQPEPESQLAVVFEDDHWD